MCEAIVRESDGIDLGDERLNKRSQLLIASLARDVQASVNAACETWVETQAAYRLFDNKKVTSEKFCARIVRRRCVAFENCPLR